MRQNDIPTTRSMRNVFFDETYCIAWLIDSGVLHKPLNCTDCGGDVSGSEKNLRCTRKVCRKRVSLVSRTFFALSRLECCEILYFGYLWLANCTSDVIRHLTNHSSKTVTAYCLYFRQLVASTLESDDEVIGGDGIVIQVDETKMGLFLT